MWFESITCYFGDYQLRYRPLSIIHVIANHGFDVLHIIFVMGNAFTTYTMFGAQYRGLSLKITLFCSLASLLASTWKTSAKSFTVSRVIPNVFQTADSEFEVKNSKIRNSEPQYGIYCFIPKPDYPLTSLMLNPKTKLRNLIWRTFDCCEKNYYRSIRRV